MANFPKSSCPDKIFPSSVFTAKSIDTPKSSAPPFPDQTSADRLDIGDDLLVRFELGYRPHDIIAIDIRLFSHQESSHWVSGIFSHASVTAPCRASMSFSAGLEGAAPTPASRRPAQQRSPSRLRQAGPAESHYANTANNNSQHNNTHLDRMSDAPARRLLQ